MPQFSSDTITRIVNQGEQNISVDKPFLVDRYEPSIVANTAIYTLPDYVTSIRRVTYEGSKIDPLPQRNQREVFQAATQVGKPFWYVFDNLGANKIKFFPTPPTNIVAGVNPWVADIATKVIVEFYRVSDNNAFVIPAYLKRQLLKQYLARQLYTLEGPGQKKSLAQYYDNKYQMFKEGFIEHLVYLHGSPRKLIINDIVSSNYFPASPILPVAQFGTAVDEGY